MTKLKTLKKELKEVEKDIRRNKGDKDLNKDLRESLREEIKLKENLRQKGYKTKTFNSIEKKFEKYEPKIKLLDNVKYVGNKVMRIRFDRDKYNGNSFTEKEVKKISDEMSAYMEKKGLKGKIMTSMNYGVLGWRSGYFSDIGDDVRLYNPADSHINMEIVPQIKSFVVYSVIKQNPAGGNDIFNDCLYNCLKDVLHIRLKTYFPTPESLKRYLGLKRCDKVPLDCIEKIEQKLKSFQINVRGDYIYTSTVKSEKVINLLLIGEHYLVDAQKRKQLVNINFDEKIPLLYDKLTFEIYDGKEKRKISIEEKYKLNSFSSKYIIIDRERQRPKGGYIEISLEEEYNKLIPIIENLKRESNGMINLYKSGNYKNTALHLFDSLTQYINRPEEILQDEAEWIKEASIGAIIFSECYEGELYKYDVKSMYPHLMTQQSLKFPLKRGEFQKLEQLPEYPQFGIYRCKILKSDNKDINKLFRFSEKNYYTSISLQHAKELNLKIELIQDNKPNSLCYSRDKLITFNEVFKPFVDILYDLKNRGVEKSKDILNRLWGALCEVETVKYFCDKEINISSDEEIYELRPYSLNEDIDIIETNKINKRYKTNYARLCPFLIAQGRKYIKDIMFEHKENIYLCHTDGFLINKKIHSNIDVEIGELKYEGFTTNGKINNCNSFVEVHY